MEPKLCYNYRYYFAIFRKHLAEIRGYLSNLGKGFQKIRDAEVLDNILYDTLELEFYSNLLRPLLPYLT